MPPVSMLIEFGLQSKPVYICSVLSAFVHKLSSMYFSHRHTHISLEAEIHFNVEICAVSYTHLTLPTILRV